MVETCGCDFSTRLGHDWIMNVRIHSLPWNICHFKIVVMVHRCWNERDFAQRWEAGARSLQSFVGMMKIDQSCSYATSKTGTQDCVKRTSGIGLEILETFPTKKWISCLFLWQKYHVISLISINGNRDSKGRLFWRSLFCEVTKHVWIATCVLVWNDKDTCFLSSLGKQNILRE